MWVIPHQTGGADSASGVDFAHHPFAQPLGIGTGHHRADEFVAEDAVEAFIAAGDFDIGITNAGHLDLDQRFAGGGCGRRAIGIEVQRSVKYHSTHD